MSCHRSLPPEWPSGHLQFKMKTQASVRSSIREREYTMSIDIQDAYLRIPMARPIQKYFQFIVIGWVYQFSLAASLSMGIYQGGKVSPRGQSPCLPGLLAYLRLIPCTGQFGPASVAAPRLGDPFQQVWFATQTAVQFHSYAIQYVHLHCDTPAQNGDQNPEHTGSLEIAHPRVTTRDLHRLLGMLTFMVTLVPRGQFCLCPIQWWASEAWCQETGSWSDRISVAPTILHQVAGWASPAVLHGVSPSALQTEITLFTDASRHRWRHSWAPISCKGCGPGSRQASTSIWDGGSAPECSRVPASTQVSCSVPDVRQRRGCVVHNQGRRYQIIQTDLPDDSAP